MKRLERKKQEIEDLEKKYREEQLQLRREEEELREKRRIKTQEDLEKRLNILTVALW